jgi:hypothetical protein
MPSTQSRSATNRDDRDAKAFGGAEIVEQPRLEGSALSEVERKMLYFSQSGVTLLNMSEVTDLRPPTIVLRS